MCWQSIGDKGWYHSTLNTELCSLLWDEYTFTHTSMCINVPIHAPQRPAFEPIRCWIQRPSSLCSTCDAFYFGVNTHVTHTSKCTNTCTTEASLRANKVLETKAFIAQFLEQQEAAKRAREARDAAEEQKRQDHWTMVGGGCVCVCVWGWECVCLCVGSLRVLRTVWNTWIECVCVWVSEWLACTAECVMHLNRILTVPSFNLE